MSNPDYGQTPIYQQTSSLAVISLIMAIISFFALPLLGAIAAVITGIAAKKEIVQSDGHLTGEGIARWGTILGWVNIGINVFGVFLWMLIVAGIISISLCFIPYVNAY